MSAIDELFAKLRAEKRKALMPFITAGDPDLDFTAAVIEEMVARGASMCEVGIPYSDPIADGPVIQASYTRSLNKGIKLKSILETLGNVAPQLAAPIVTMVSYAIIYRHGVEKYADELKQRGVAGMIVPDLPLEESPRLAKVCQARDLSLIQLITPLTPRDRALKIAETSSGFIYYVSVGRHHWRANRTAARAGRTGRLAPRTNSSTCLHRLRHQPAGARQAASPRCRRPHRRLRHRPPHGKKWRREWARKNAQGNRRLRGGVCWQRWNSPKQHPL